MYIYIYIYTYAQTYIYIYTYIYDEAWQIPRQLMPHPRLAWLVACKCWSLLTQTWSQRNPTRGAFWLFGAGCLYPEIGIEHGRTLRQTQGCKRVRKDGFGVLVVPVLRIA
jgi:hypothetical protein